MKKPSKESNGRTTKLVEGDGAAKMAALDSLTQQVLRTQKPTSEPNVEESQQEEIEDAAN